MRYATAILLLTLSTVLTAQTGRPQMTWSGYITGSATLYIQGNRADIQGRDTGAVDRPNAQFFADLPSARTLVNMQVRRGRGRVEIVEQPNPGNEFAAVVQINAPGRQAELYNLDFYWDRNADTSRDRPGDGRGRWENRGRNSGSASEERGELRWSGEVDGEIMVEVRGERASSRIVRGQSITGERFDISSALPRQSTTVRLEDVRGRGRVELVDQPGSQNGYAAIVRVRDEGSGRAPYSFRLVWDGGGRSNDADTVLRPSTQGERRSGNDGVIRTAVPDQGFARWTGQVDGRVHVTIRGNRATSTTVTGKPVSGMNVDFGGGPGIPARRISDVQVRKVQGRGEVHVVQTPDARNGSALVFEIEDKGSGSDTYEVEITWR